MVGNEFIEAPEEEAVGVGFAGFVGIRSAEGGGVEVRVHVDALRRRERILNCPFNLSY